MNSVKVSKEQKTKINNLLKEVATDFTFRVEDNCIKIKCRKVSKRWMDIVIDVSNILDGVFPNIAKIINTEGNYYVKKVPLNSPKKKEKQTI